MGIKRVDIVRRLTFNVYARGHHHESTPDLHSRSLLLLGVVIARTYGAISWLPDRPSLLKQTTYSIIADDHPVGMHRNSVIVLTYLAGASFHFQLLSSRT